MIRKLLTAVGVGVVGFIGYKEWHHHIIETAVKAKLQADKPGVVPDATTVKNLTRDIAEHKKTQLDADVGILNGGGFPQTAAFVKTYADTAKAGT